MVKFIARTERVGRSIMIRVPEDIAQDFGCDEFVEVRKIRKDFFGAVPGLKPFSRDDKL